MTFDEWCDKERLSCQYSYQLDALEDAWNARIPEGYVLVPVEPTEKMLKTARNAPMPLVHLDSFTACSNLILKTQYKAMIQAAQEDE